MSITIIEVSPKYPCPVDGMDMLYICNTGRMITTRDTVNKVHSARSEVIYQCAKCKTIKAF